MPTSNESRNHKQGSEEQREFPNGMPTRIAIETSRTMELEEPASILDT
jgi:hypothetical protein